MIRLSYSRVSSFLSCRKRYWWAYHEGLIPKKKPTPLQVGDIVHELFHLYYERKLPDISKLEEWVQDLYPFNELQTSLDVARQAASLFVGYLKHYEDDPLELVSSEVHLEFPLYDDLILYGRVDGLVKSKDGKLWRLERKTSSSMDSHFLQGLRNSLQAGIYDFLLEKTLSPSTYGTVYDILVKTKVPQYNRNFVLKNRKVIDRALETLRGVWKDLKTCMEDPSMFYPSSECFIFRECDYTTLCNFDSPEARETFYISNKEGKR